MTDTANIRTLWVHPFNGVAGDMFLGALIDAGASLEAIRSELGKLQVDGWELSAEPIMRNGISAINVQVACNEGHVHRTAADIEAIVRQAGLSPRVTERATSVFAALAKAEGSVHAKPADQVHFHEVGGIDAIVDVVGSCIGLELLNIDQLISAPIAQGRSIVRSAHGPIPNPAPATVRLLEGLPIRGLDVEVELTTPTGAALLRTLARFESLPEMIVESNGFGAGDNELDPHPNLLHVIVGEVVTVPETVERRQMLIVETNVDDVSAEYIAHAISQLMNTGANDAWATPITMKKGRLGHTISALIAPEALPAVGSALLAETGSLGYRVRTVHRDAVERTTATVEIEGHKIRVKVSGHSAKAEFDDVAVAAEALGRPARVIAAEAEREWANHHSTTLDL